MLDKLKNFDPRGGVMLEDAIVLAAYARQISAEYDLLKIDKPEWLTEQTERVRQFVADSVRDAKKRKLAELKSRRDALKTATERRDELDKQIAELEAPVQA